MDHFLRQGQKQKKANRRQRPEENSPATFGASSRPVECVSSPQKRPNFLAPDDQQSSQAEENATARRTARRWHCWFRRAKMQKPLCDLGLGQERSTNGPNGSTRLVTVLSNSLNFGSVPLTHIHIPTFERPNLQNSRQKVRLANQTM